MERIHNRRTDAPPLLSILMLVKDVERWCRFVPKRLVEMKRIAEAAPFLSFEVIFVLNDAPPSGIEAMIADALFPITVVLHGENHIPRARNIAVRESRGTYIIVWDDDDILHTPDAIPLLLTRYQELPLGVVCVELLRTDGQRLHPQEPHLMPQRPHPSIEGVLITGMQHTPFITRRSIATALPLSEVRCLRGEWIDWSSRLWRAGLPVGYLRWPHCVFQDENDGPSATRNDDAFLHTLISLLSLAFEYDLTNGTDASQILYRRFAERELTRRFSDPIDAWHALLSSGRTLALSNGLGADAAFQAAWSYLTEHHHDLAEGKCRITREMVYDVPPFGLFETSRASLFEECLATASKRLEGYTGG